MVLPPPQVRVHRFDRNLESYESPLYKETQARRELLDPLLALMEEDKAALIAARKTDVCSQTGDNQDRVIIRL